MPRKSNMTYEKMSFSLKIFRIHKEIEEIISPFILATILNYTSAVCLMVYRLSRGDEVGKICNSLVSQFNCTNFQMQTSRNTLNLYYFISGIVSASLIVLKLYWFCDAGQRLLDAVKSFNFIKNLHCLVVGYFNFRQTTSMKQSMITTRGSI